MEGSGRQAIPQAGKRSGANVGVESELRRLRRRLADAWWYEEPLEVIEHLEHEINRRLAHTKQ